jgi:hypothetical protein
MIEGTLIDRLNEFMECEGRSCSFDPELITSEYVYRMWGGRWRKTTSINLDDNLNVNY